MGEALSFRPVRRLNVVQRPFRVSHSRDGFLQPTRRVKTCLTMAEPLRTVALLVANPALSSILSMTLAGASSLRVRPFETQTALMTYLHLVPTDLVVADFDSVPARAD